MTRKDRTSIVFVGSSIKNLSCLRDPHWKWNRKCKSTHSYLKWQNTTFSLFRQSGLSKDWKRKLPNKLMRKFGSKRISCKSSLASRSTTCWTRWWGWSWCPRRHDYQTWSPIWIHSRMSTVRSPRLWICSWVMLWLRPSRLMMCGPWIWSAHQRLRWSLFKAIHRYCQKSKFKSTLQHSRRKRGGKDKPKPPKLRFQFWRWNGFQSTSSL